LLILQTHFLKHLQQFTQSIKPTNLLKLALIKTMKLELELMSNQDLVQLFVFLCVTKLKVRAMARLFDLIN